MFYLELWSRILNKMQTYSTRKISLALWDSRIVVGRDLTLPLFARKSYQFQQTCLEAIELKGITFSYYPSEMKPKASRELQFISGKINGNWRDNSGTTHWSRKELLFFLYSPYSFLSLLHCRFANPEIVLTFNPSADIEEWYMLFKS